MLYVDANVFIYATINTQELGNKARALLGRIQYGDETAMTSVLTFDEVFWVIKKTSIQLAFEAYESLLNFPNLQIVSADKTVASSALGIIRQYNLAPRDAVHAATALLEQVDCIVTTDDHFNRIKELKRRNL